MLQSCLTEEVFCFSEPVIVELLTDEKETISFIFEVFDITTRK